MRCLVFLLVVLVGPGALQGAELPKVLFFANPMSSDNDVIRRPRPDVPSVAERHFARLSQGVFDVTITQDGAEVTRAKLARYKAVVFFTAINPPGVNVDGLIDWVREGGAFVGIHSTANTFQGHPAFGAMLGARYDRRPWRTREAPRRGSGSRSWTAGIRRRDISGSRSRLPTTSTSSRTSTATGCACCSARTPRASTSATRR